MKQDFLELENKWMDAWKNKDEAVCREILADDFTLTSSLSNELVYKEDWIYKAINHYHNKNFNIKIIKERVYDDIALLNIHFHQEATANDKDWNGDFLITDVWKQNGNKWQVVLRHSTWLKNS
jgi:DNA-directed RNA polymerase subunit L